MQKALHSNTLHTTNSIRTLKFSLLFLFLSLGIQGFGQTTTCFDFDNGYSDGTTFSNQSLDANIRFTTYQNSASTNTRIWSNQLRCYQNSSKGGGFVIEALNGVTITSVVINASGTTGPAEYIVDGGSAVSLSASGTYSMTGLTATTDVEFYQKDGSSSNRIYMDDFCVTYTSGATTWTITYDGNSPTSGTAPTDGSSPYTDGATVTVLGNSGSLAKTCNTFNGWNSAADGSGTSFSVSSTFSITQDTTLYADWTPTGQTVTFDNNGGSGTMTDQTNCAATNLTANTFTRTGYTFANWNTASDGSGTTYADAASYSFASSTTLYAQWTIDNYTITFDGNSPTSGSPSVASVSGNYNTSVTLATIGSLAKTNYTFDGWNTASDGSGTDYAAGASHTILNDMTLYAKWTIITHDVTFDKNDVAATGTMSDQTINQGASATLTANGFSNSGYTFDEWNTASDGSGTSYADGASFTMGGSDVTLYAQWAVYTGPCASESFNNSGNSGSYSTEGWTGDNGIDWTATDSRSDQDLNGNEAIMLRNGSLTNDSIFSNGCGVISFDYARIYTGNSTLKVYVNGIQYGGDIAVSLTSSTTFSTTVNVGGAINVELENSGNRTLINELTWTCYSAGAEIDVKGGSPLVSIANGDATPSTTDHTDFGQSEVGGTPITRTFTIENTGGADLTLTGTGPTYVAISGTHAGDFSVTANPSTPISAAGSTTFTVTFTPGALGTRSATLTIANDDTDENPYVFDIEGEGTNSLSSDIANDVSFSYSSDIDYTSYQAANITNTAQSVAVWRFTIRDGGPGLTDADSYPTILDDITFSSIAGIDNIRAAALFDGNALVDNNEVINKGAGTIAFTGINYSTADNSSRNLTLRITFETTVTDNEQMSFTIASANLATTGASSSSFATFGIVSSTGADRNRIEVTADRLVYGQQPSDANQGLSMTPAVTVRGEDVNGNLDLDWTDDVDITSPSGTLSGTTVTETAVGGIATFGSLVHTATGTGLTLNAAHSTFSSVVSSTFDITTFSYAAGDYRPLWASQDFSWNGSWEYFDGTSWGVPPGGCAGGCAPQNAPSTPTRIIIHLEGITGGGNTANSYNDIIILSGGELILNDVDASPAADFILSGRTLEVQTGGILELSGDIELHSGAFLTVRDGATLKLNSPNMRNNHPLWSGTELIEGGSTTIITDWDFSTSATNRSLINIHTAIDNNANGYKFGEVIFDADPTDNWTIVGGSMLPTTYICENDFTVINQSATYYVGVMSNRTAGISCVFGGNLYVEDGDFAFGTSYTSDAFNQTITVLGDFEMTSDGVLNLHKNAVSTATSNSSELHVFGDFIVDGPSAFNSDLPSSSNAMKLFLSDTNLVGSYYDTLSIEPIITGVKINIDNDSVVVVGYDLRFEDDTEIEIEPGAYFDFGFDGGGTALNVVAQPSATGNLFQFKAGASLVVTSPGGIWELTGTSNGNVKGMTASEKSFGQSGSTFYFVGKTDQETGDAFTAGQTTKDIFVNLENNDDVLTVTSTTGIASGSKLEIQSGIVDNTDAAYIYGNGNLVISGGGLRTDVLAATATAEPSSNGYVPLLSGNYKLIDTTVVGSDTTFSGGFVELYSSGDQVLRGARDYYDLKISGNNSFGTSKTVSTAFTIAHNLDITDNSEFDIENRAMTGNANITMDNGLLRMAALGKTLPELLATSAGEPYELTGGSIEWYGTTSASSSQNIRGRDGFGSGRTIEYFNIEINATSANVDDFNVGAQAGFEVGGVMNVNAPAVFQLDEDDHIDDVGTPFNAGEFYLQPGATLKYGDIYGITTGTTTGVTAGAIRVTGGGGRGASNFPTTASYGFVSPSDMVTGNGFPTTAENIYVDKTAEDATVTLTNNLSIKTNLQMDQGHIITDGNDFELGISTTDKGTLVYGQDSPQVPGFVIGAMERWFDGTNSGDASGLFPLGDYFGGDYRNKHSLIEYTSAPTTGGSLVTTFVAATDMGIAGISLIPTISGGCTFDVETTEDEGYWNIERANGLSNDGTYTSAITGEGFQTINTLCELTELKRPSGGGNWTAPGTHLSPTGTLAIPTVSRSGLSGFSDFGFGGGDDNLLPIELLSFVAYKSGRNSQLEWVTASELNNEKFLIEHSLNGVDFSTVGQIAGAGTSSSEKYYEFLHEQPVNGKNYYRLKQIDFDGTYSYSPIRLVEHDDAYPFAVQVLGNPVQNGELEVSIFSSRKMTTTMAIFATDGKLVKMNVFDLEKGTTIKNMSMDDMADGVYFLSVTNDEMNQGFKVIKSR